MNPLLIFVMLVHVLVAAGLILLVLLHSGKGTGLSSMFGAMPSAITGTSIIEKNLDRITIAFAGVFTLTSLILMLGYRP